MQALCTKRESFTRLLDEEECYRQLRRLRWPDGKVRCPYCGGEIFKSWAYFRQPFCHRYQCGSCGISFNDKTGTIFEHSKLPLSAWFLGFYLAQLSQSTSTVAKELPCHYRTAHRIMWLVREQMVRLEGGRVLKGTVEADEIYVTSGHKGQAPGGGAKELPFPPSAKGQEEREGKGECRQGQPGCDRHGWAGAGSSSAGCGA